MYDIKYHPFLEEDLKQLGHSVRIEVFKKQIRIVYEIVNNILVVYILAIGKREDMEVYKQAEQRR